MRFHPVIGRAVAALLAAGVIGIAGVWAGARERLRLEDQATQRLEIVAQGLRSELEKYEAIPALIARDPRIMALMAAPNDPDRRDDANRFLEEVNQTLGASVAYIMDTDGATLAASNWRDPLSFVGRNFSYRPYVTDALTRGVGRFYGVGTTSGEPGYYVARTVSPVAEGPPLGVAVLKVSLLGLEKGWGAGSDKVLIADSDGVVALASRPEWRLKSLAPLTGDARARQAEVRRYAEADIQPLDWTQPPLDAYLQVRRPWPDGSWILLALTPSASERRTMGAAMAGAAAGLAILALLWREARRRVRAAAELETKVRERTAELSSVVGDLTREVAERQRAEQALRRAQNGLVQAAKMAALGQLSASVAHEINQPLAALRTLSDNARAFFERNKLDRVRDNLTMIGDLVDRIAGITWQLRNFARRSDGDLSSAPVGARLRAATALLADRLERGDVALKLEVPLPDPVALCDPVRLEQVFVNLLANALDAVTERPHGEQRITVTVSWGAGGRVLIKVQDSGPGFPPESLEHLFEPFHTTKAAGLGLGLAISAAIVQDFGGALAARNRDEGGAEVTVDLPAAPAPSDQPSETA